jgi:hypothetical protein
VSALCLFVDDLLWMISMDDLDPSNVGKPPQFDGLWVEFFVLG